MIPHAMSTRKALALASLLGCRIWTGKGGEIKVSHPTQPRLVCMKGTRKESPRSLTQFLRKVERDG